jgi:hypothetical protein
VLGLARLLVLVMGLAVAVAAGLAIVPDDPPRRGASPAAVRKHGQADHHQPASGGVGDSRSDDPSDDEPDGPEP